MNHTSIPWAVTRDGYRIMQDQPSSCKVIAVLAHNKQERNPEARANASHIVLCVNSHDELMEVLKETSGVLYRWVNEKGIGMEECKLRSQLVEKVTHAIAKAEGKQ